MKLLEVNNLVVKYDVEVVRNISYYVKKGEIVCIVGESGSGKSTSILAILGLLGNKADGRIYFDKKDISPIYKNKKEFIEYEKNMKNIRGNKVSYIFQNPISYLNPLLNIGEQISETIRTHKDYTKKEALKRTKELLNQLEISNKRMKQYPHELSGGILQRVLIAIALSCEPKLIIADEPTSSLDVTIQAQILNIIKEETEKRNMSAIIVTHDLGIALQLCQRIIIMYAGKIVEEGKVENIFKSPKHPYTLGLLDSVKSINQDDRLKTIEGKPPDFFSLPKGCAFVSRCKYAMKICKYYEPPEKFFDLEHRCFCWLYLKSG